MVVLIRHRDWRRTIVGCSAALLVRDARFLDDLLYRFREYSWVSPQLAVALGIVHPVEAVAEFEALLGEAAGSDRPEEVVLGLCRPQAPGSRRGRGVRGGGSVPEVQG